MGPKGILTAQKQKYYSNSNNLSDENNQGETGKQKEIKVSFGKVYRPCCCRASPAFGSPVSGKKHLWTQVTTQPHSTGSHTSTCKTSSSGRGEGEPQHRRARLDPAEAVSLSGAQCTIFPTSLFFKGSFLIVRPPCPRLSSPFPHVTGIQGKYFSQPLQSGPPPLAFRGPLYQTRSRQAGQTLPQGHCESGLGA